MSKVHNARRLLSLTLALLAIAGSLLTIPTHSAGRPANSAADAVSLVGPAPYVRQISLATKDLVYDPVTRMIYASVPSSAGSVGNSITPINPFSGTVGSSVFVGSEPGKLALSDNGQNLYVSLDGAAAVRRFDVASQTPGLQFTLGNGAGTGPLYVEDMAVLPGSPNSIAVSRRNQGFSPRHEGVAIYDNGVQRSTTTASHTGSNCIEFSANASTIYGYNNETTEFGLRKMTVNSSGVSVNSTTPNLITGFGVDFKFDNGLIYATTGRVVDPQTGTITGTFTLDSQFGNQVLPDSRTGRVYFLSGSGATTTITAFDQRTFLRLGSMTIQGVSGTPTSLIRWGANGLAFRTTGDQVILIRSALVPSIKLVSDFDGDEKADVAVWRPADGNWYVQQNNGGSFSAQPFGLGTDKIVPGDYDGDQLTDVAVFRPAEGSWYILQSSDNQFKAQQWGQNEDKPVAGDYDGDGKTDLAVFRPSDSYWYILQSSNNSLRAQPWGLSEDKPVPGDYDGDGRIDLAVFRPSNGMFYILQSSNNSLRAQPWGLNTDVPVVADYDGDGKTDLAVFRSSEGFWYILQSSNNSFRAQPWGLGTDRPLPGDFDGDGRADLAVFRPSDNTWYIQQSSNWSLKTRYFGAGSDVPVSSAYMY